VDGSEPFPPLGHEPEGTIMYTPDGYMVARLAKPDWADAHLKRGPQLLPALLARADARWTPQRLSSCDIPPRVRRGSVVLLPCACAVMYLGVQMVGADERLQGGCEVTGLLRGQPVEDLALVRLGDLPQRSQQGLAVSGEMQLVVAAVGAAAGTRDQAALLEAVDECDHPAGRGADAVGERPLAEAGRSADQT
jgi:hypothetical protein